jgi:YrbI family 3-deoxy-D-manno-octulosonate 8-phosphate phosphatase
MQNNNLPDGSQESKIKMKEIFAKAKKIKVFAMDVDGVLTDGKLIFSESGFEMKGWNVRDRIAFYILNRLGYKTCWISGRKCREVSRRAKDLRINGVFLGVKNKTLLWEKILKNFKAESASILYIGDDLVDAGLLKKAGLSVCPADAPADVKNLCDFVAKSRGGDGVFREVVELVLKAQNKWKDVLQYYGF